MKRGDRVYHGKRDLFGAALSFRGFADRLEEILVEYETPAPSSAWVHADDLVLASALLSDPRIDQNPAFAGALAGAPDLGAKVPEAAALRRGDAMAGPYVPSPEVAKDLRSEADKEKVEALKGWSTGEQILRDLAQPPPEFPNGVGHVPSPGFDISRGPALPSSVLPPHEFGAEDGAGLHHCKHCLRTFLGGALKHQLASMENVKRRPAWWRDLRRRGISRASLRALVTLSGGDLEEWEKPAPSVARDVVTLALVLNERRGHHGCPARADQAVKDVVRDWEANARALVHELQAEVADLMKEVDDLKAWQPPAAGRAFVHFSIREGDVEVRDWANSDWPVGRVLDAHLRRSGRRFDAAVWEVSRDFGKVRIDPEQTVRAAGITEGDVVTLRGLAQNRGKG